MEPTTLIIAAVALLVLGGLGWAVTRKKTLELPSEAPAPSEREQTEHLELDEQVVLEERPVDQAPAAPSLRPGAADFAALKSGLQPTRGNLVARLAGLFKKGAAVDPSTLEQMEEILITADVGVHTTQKILAQMTTELSGGALSTGEQALSTIRSHARNILSGKGHDLDKAHQPTVVLVIGVNGVGKTTTIGKLASRLKDHGHSVLLAAGDTFRAAAVTQLEVWGRRVECDVVRGGDRVDPGSVIFDAIKKAQDDGTDFVICDTAGRLHTKVPLMDELQKVGRTVEKALGRPADHVLLVLDATTGQNANQQTELFKQALPISGLVLTKLDGTAKGGVILGIVDQHQVPVRYIGIGERVEDLRPFHAESFVEALFAKDEDDLRMTEPPPPPPA